MQALQLPQNRKVGFRKKKLLCLSFLHDVELTQNFAYAHFKIPNKPINKNKEAFKRLNNIICASIAIAQKSQSML